MLKSCDRTGRRFIAWLRKRSDGACGFEMEIISILRS